MGIAFGNRLRKVRKAENLTQKQVAESIGVNQKQYQHWERGRAEPSFDIIQRLAYLFEVDIEWLLYGKGKLITHDDNASTFIREIQLFLKDNPQSLPLLRKMFGLFMSEIAKTREKSAKDHKENKFIFKKEPKNP